MTVVLISVELWAAVALRLRPERLEPEGDGPRIDHRRALAGIVFVLVIGVPWEHPPRAVAGCSGMTR